MSARAGPEPGRSRAGAGPEPARVRAGRKRESGAEARPGQSRARAERSERQPGRSRASVRWRTAGATCSAAWPPTLRSSEPAGAGVGAGAGPEPWSESQSLVQSGTGRSRLELQPGLCGARAGAGETSIVVHTVYVPIPKL